MKYSLRAGQFAGDLLDVAAQDRRQIGIHNRGVAARHQAQQRADRMAGGDLGEAGLPRQLGEALFVGGVFPGVHQHDGAGGDAVARASAMTARALVLVERFDLGAVHADAAADLGNPFIQHGRQGDREVEQARPGLIADAQGVGKAAIDQQQGAVAFALQQRVGGDSGAHFDRLDLAGRDRLLGRQTEDRPDAGDGGVLVALRVFGQQFVSGQLSVRMRARQCR